MAIMALVAAISIDRGIYFAMNAPAALTGGTVETAAAWVNSLGLTGVNITPGDLAQTAKDVGEQSIVSRTGGAPTLAVGLAHIMQQFIGGTAMMAFWYHFAIMFEALFILTAVDAGTRVARFMLQDSIGNFVPKFKEHSWRPGAWLCTAIMVAAWGAVLLMGVTDPLGGINTLFPLFGIANQLLAAIALSVCLAIVAKRSALKYLWIVAVPLAFAAVVTITASFYKIFSPVPAVGYFANNAAFAKALADGKTSFGTAKTAGGDGGRGAQHHDPGLAVDHLRGAEHHRHHHGRDCNHQGPAEHGRGAAERRARRPRPGLPRLRTGRVHPHPGGARARGGVEQPAGRAAARKVRTPLMRSRP